MTKEERKNELKSLFVKKGMTYADIGKILDISETSVGNKVRGKNAFTVDEILKLYNALNLQGKIEDLFFT